MLQKLFNIMLFGAIVFIVLGLMALPGEYPRIGAMAVFFGLIFTILAGGVGFLMMWAERHG